MLKIFKHVFEIQHSNSHDIYNSEFLTGRVKNIWNVKITYEIGIDLGNTRILI